ncbi:PhzF family phenazine biosynthesis protein, partial [Rhizobium ruizarguesonis]
PVAGCVSLDPGVLVSTTPAPVFASVGLTFAVAELNGLEALDAARPNLAGFQAAAGGQTTSGHDFSLFVYVRAAENPWNIR